MMARQVCIFRERCKRCNQLSLASEKHDCIGTKTTKRQRLIEDISQFLSEYGSFTSAALCTVINKKYGGIPYSHFQIEYILKKNPKVFSRDYARGSNYWGLKIEVCKT